MDTEKEMIINELCTSKYLKVIAHLKTDRSEKSVLISAKARNEGNILYVKKHHDASMHMEIFRLYCKSIAFAPNNSVELAQGYGNRSAILFHMKKYNKCIQDIDKALEITDLGSLKIKLQNRKLECLRLLKVVKEEVQDDIKTSNKTTEIDKNENCFDDFSVLTEDKKNLLKIEKVETLRNSVRINYNTKYGRHLVATRDIQTGEIIFIKEPYVTSLNIKQLHIYCGHCLTIAWAGIPCDHCGWFMFCSEKCKVEAWRLYHDIECACIKYIVHFLNNINEDSGQTFYFDGLSIRAVIKGLREMGNLKKLKAELQSVDKCTDKCTKGFSKNGKFENNFRSLYSLSCDLPLEEAKKYSTFAAVSLICMAKYTKLFGEHFEFAAPENLSRNTDVVFIGALLLKLSKISHFNSHCIMNVNDDSSTNCKCKNELLSCTKVCCAKGAFIAPFASLLNHSCNPNARRCFTNDTKIILYALQPIKKNSQIWDSYYCTFFEASYITRQSALKKDFYFTCYCIACMENWPCWPIADKDFESLMRIVKLSPEEFQQWEENCKTIKSIENGSICYDYNLLQHISKEIENSIVNLNQPSVLTYKLIFTLIQVFERLYGYSTQEFKGCKN